MVKKTRKQINNYFINYGYAKNPNFSNLSVGSLYFSCQGKGEYIQM